MLLASATAVPLAAEQYLFDITLTSDLHHHEVNLGGVEPWAEAVVAYDDASKQLIAHVEWSGLTGNPLAVAFHGPAAWDATASAVLPLTISGNTATVTTTLNQEQGAALLGANWYLNIRTAANPEGELRGQATRKQAAYYRSFPISWAQVVDMPTVGSAKPGGWGVASYDRSTKLLKYYIAFEDTTGPATSVAFHAAASYGHEAPVEVTLPQTGSPIVGSMQLSSSQEYTFSLGSWYVNVATSANPGGEIRGQVVETPRLWTWSLHLSPDAVPTAPTLGGSSPEGDAFIILDALHNTLVWYFNHEDTTGAPYNAGFHGPALPGQNADKLLNILDKASGSWFRVIPISDQMERLLLTDRLYLDFATYPNPAGELRSYIVDDKDDKRFDSRFSMFHGEHTVDPGPSTPDGYYIAHLDAETGVLYYWMEWWEMSGTVSTVNLGGPAMMKKAGGVLHELEDAYIPNRLSVGKVQLSPPEVHELNAGMVYINVETALNPQGELRAQVLSPLFNDAYYYSGSSEGYVWSDWLGFFWAGNRPWIYHMVQGWLYTNSANESGVTMWLPGQEWIWTTSFLYPWYYDYQTGEWTWFPNW